MNTSRGRIGTFLATTTGLVAAAVMVAAAPAGALVPPTVPEAIKVPAGQTLYLVGHARGYQIYTCQASNGGFAWVLLQPWAGLYDDNGNPIAIHFAGPTWQSPDGSAVVAARVNGVPAPSPTAIPWLLLAAVSHSGPSGGTFSNTSYIQRLNTTGGVAPTTGCDAAHAGATTAVFYTADYYFYRPATG